MMLGPQKKLIKASSTQQLLLPNQISTSANFKSLVKLSEIPEIRQTMKLPKNPQHLYVNLQDVAVKKRV
jgi:hypothetical protein